MPRSLMPCGQPKLSSMPSAPASWVFLVISCQASRVDSTISDTKSARSGYAFLTRAISFEVDLERPIGDQFDIIETHHLSAVVIDGAVARRDVDDRLVGERLPDGASPAGVEGAANLVLGVGRRAGRQPEGVRRLHSAEFDRQIGHPVPALLVGGRETQRGYALASAW